MVKYELTFDKENCIGCGACVSVCPNRWKMGDDGKSQIIGSSETLPGKFVKEISDDEFSDNMEAANSCPVNVIHLRNLDEDKELI